MTKLIVAVLALLANFGIQWFAHYGGKLSNAGTFLGISYDSALGSAIAFNLKLFWYWIPINIAFVYASKTGVNAFGSFLTFMIIWLAAAPIAALIYSTVIAKEAVNIVHIAGIILIFTGSVLVSANKEILTYLKDVL